MDKVISCRVMSELERRGDLEAIFVTVLAIVMMEMSAGNFKRRKEDVNDRLARWKRQVTCCNLASDDPQHNRYLHGEVANILGPKLGFVLIQIESTWSGLR